MCRKMADYIGLPYLNGGRDPGYGLDCWGLILLVGREQYAQNIPDFLYQDAENTVETGKLFDFRRFWSAIPFGQERAGDVVVLLIAGTPCHAGIVVSPGMMLHTLAQHSAALDRYSGTKWAHRIEGFYRWVL